MNGSEGGEGEAQPQPDTVDQPGETLGGYADAAASEAMPGAAEDPHQLDLQESDRLPWLESADDDEDDGAVDTRRVAIFVLAGLALLAAIVGGVWWSTHRGHGDERVADGSTINAPAQPYKQAPENPGGKTYAGTGDSSFAVSQGHAPVAHLAAGPDEAARAAANGTVKTAEQAGAVAMAAAKGAGGDHAATGAGAAGAAETAITPGSTAGSVGVQVGAYTNQATAEAGWTKLSRQYAPLAQMHHRVVQGQADIGTVYRLQAVPENESAANALCSGMRAQGLACQVKH